MASEANIYRDMLFGLAIGDALGVPVEFKSRSHIALRPIREMEGFGTHNMPAGTFSDDSSLAFCLAEALTMEFDIAITAQNFIKWRYNNYWTANGNVFDIGIATDLAISKLSKGVKPSLAGGTDIASNGNGSLMRILPLLAFIKDKPVEERFEITRQVSSVTHGHIRSVIACFYYLEFARLLLGGKDKFEIYMDLRSKMPDILNSLGINSDEITIFHRLFKTDIYKLPVDAIYSSGYVVHTLEASIWCLLTTGNYAEAVLKAVNLDEDTDTTGAVTGGLAGVLYGFVAIPASWVKQLARHHEIEDLANRMVAFYDV